MKQEKRWIERSFWDDLLSVWPQRFLAWQLFLADIAEQRRNSGLGLVAPFISVLVHVTLLGSVMGLVFHEPLVGFIPFFAISFSLWQGLSIWISDAANANERLSNYIGFPGVTGYVIHISDIFDFLISTGLKLFASLIIVSFVDFRVISEANYFGIAIGLAFTTAALVSWSLPVAYIFDQFRLLRGFLPQVLFAVYLVTPILWMPDRLLGYRWIVELNPVYHIIEVCRAPFLSGEVPMLSLGVVAALSVLGVIGSYLVYPANQKLIVFRWVA